MYNFYLKSPCIYFFPQIARIYRRVIPLGMLFYVLPEEILGERIVFNKKNAYL
jgi:hypothetical protein